MALAPAVPPVQKKRGLGCCGCGCLILVLLVLLLAGFVGAGGYIAYREMVSLTSDTPGTVPAFDGGDDLYKTTRQKMTDFDHNLQNHLAATLRLNADEINTLIAHSPDVDHKKVQVFVSMEKDQARVQASLPTSLWPALDKYLKDRYICVDSTFSVKFDTGTQTVLFTPQNLKTKDRVIYDANTPLPANEQGLLPVILQDFDQAFTSSIRKSPEGDQLLSRAKRIEVENGELVIEIGN